MQHNISHEHLYASAFSHQYGKHQRCKICTRTKIFIEQERDMSQSYFNTTDVSGAELARYQDAALSQEERLLAYFESAYNAGGHYVLLTPTNALILVFSNKVPITSVRRALSNLTRDGKLRTSGQTKGPYGRPEHYWRLVERSSQREMF